jgi:hypothetical protein
VGVVVAFRDFPRGPGRLMEPAEPSVAQLQAALAERDRQLWSARSSRTTLLPPQII